MGQKRGEGGEGRQLLAVLILDLPSFIQGKYSAVCSGNHRWTRPFEALTPEVDFTSLSSRHSPEM